MTKTHGDGRSQRFSGPRGRGWRRCICTVETTTGKAKENPSGREAARKKGSQCSVHVSPDRIKKIGLPICPAHEGSWRRLVAEDEERRKALRAKYDPGPLYSEDT
jgi:hypothetical protein